MVLHKIRKRAIDKIPDYWVGLRVFRAMYFLGNQTCQVRHNLLNKQNAEAHLAGLSTYGFNAGLLMISFCGTGSHAGPDFQVAGFSAPSTASMRPVRARSIQRWP